MDCETWNGEPGILLVIPVTVFHAEAYSILEHYITTQVKMFWRNRMTVIEIELVGQDVQMISKNGYTIVLRELVKGRLQY